MTPIKFKNKKELYEYLQNTNFDEYKKSKLSSVYFLTQYQYKDQQITEPLYFYSFQDVYFASPCDVHFFEMEENEIEDFVKEIYELDEDYTFEEIVEYEKMMHRGGIHYEIDCPQVSPFLPDEVTIVNILSESDCLDYIINQSKECDKDER